jgi:hypothetical protein
VKPNPTSLARKAQSLADEAARSELAFGLTMTSLSSEWTSLSAIGSPATGMQRRPAWREDRGQV